MQTLPEPEQTPTKVAQRAPSHRMQQDSVHPYLELILLHSTRALRLALMKIYNFPVIDLTRHEEHFVIPSRLDWRIMLMLAQAGGWSPSTLEDYDRAYVLANGAVIGPVEARQMADALAAVLDDIPDFDIPLRGPIHLFEYFSGSRKREVQTFLDFCRGGAFVITQ
jgi:hypothetical protein